MRGLNKLEVSVIQDIIDHRRRRLHTCIEPQEDEYSL